MVVSELGKPSGTSRYEKWFIVHEGLLFKRTANPASHFQLIIPKCQTISLVDQEHIENGHYGAKKKFSLFETVLLFPQNGGKNTKNYYKL